MCQDCFCNRHLSEAWVDEYGEKWDVCEGCKLHEGMSKRIREREDEVRELVEEVRAQEWTENALLASIATRDRLIKIQGERIGLLYAELAEYRAKRTLGGPPREYTPSWRASEPADLRHPACVEVWPDCHNGDYDPACCRFPKSCSC